MMPQSPESRRKRLQEYEEPSLLPFVRAEAAADCSVYWCGVRELPINSYERAWFLELLLRLSGYLKQTRELRKANFLEHKTLMPDLLDLFIKSSEEYVPVAGMTLVPGTKPIKAPSATEMQRQVKEDLDNKRYPDLRRWMPDYAHLFLNPDAPAQRQDFFGQGGMSGLYLKPDPREAASLPELPRIITSHPAFSLDIYKQHAVSLAFEDPWLKKEQRIFGEPFRDSPGFEGFHSSFPC